jgi:hypothetical protein
VCRFNYGPILLIIKKVLLIIIFLSIRCFAKTNEPNVSISPLAKDVPVVVLSSLARVLQDKINVIGTDRAEIFCAKNEYESFQIILSNTTNKAVSNINLKTGNWHFKGDPGEAAPAITLYREHYVYVKFLSPNSTAEKGWYPDALIPFINPYDGKEITNAKYLAKNYTVGSHKSQSYWVDIFVNSNVKAGQYINEIKVYSGTELLSIIPIKLNVWDFKLPNVHELKTYFGKIKDLSRYHGISEKSAECDLLKKRYQEMLLKNGINMPYEIYPQKRLANGEVIFDANYVKDLRKFTDEMHPQMFKVPSYYSNTPEKLKKYLQSYESFVMRNPWVGQAFLYIDEPDSLDDYKIVKLNGDCLNQFAPSIKLLVTEQIKPLKENFPSLEGYVDIWVPLFLKADCNDIKRRQQEGDEVWSYTALSRDSSVPVWLLDFPLLNYRIPAWFSWSLNLKGLLYWNAMSWAGSEKIDPWIDSETYSIGGKHWNGEGSLLYPGEDAGIIGPVASIRLKVFRDSVEDYDYFIILSKQIGLEESKRITSEIASSFRHFSNNPNDYLETRKNIAQIIKSKLK